LSIFELCNNLFSCFGLERLLYATYLIIFVHIGWTIVIHNRNSILFFFYESLLQFSISYPFTDDLSIFKKMVRCFMYLLKIVRMILGYILLFEFLMNICGLVWILRFFCSMRYVNFFFPLWRQPLYLLDMGKVCVHTTLPWPHMLGTYWIVVVVITFFFSLVSEFESFSPLFFVIIKFCK